MRNEPSGKPAELQATAYHEAGHAVCAYALGRDFEYATIEPQDDSAGHVRYAPYPESFLKSADISNLSYDDLQFAEVSVMCSMAGSIAQSRVSEPQEYQCEDDQRHAADIISLVIKNNYLSGALEWLYLKTKALLEGDPVYSDAVDVVAESLMEHTKLTQEQIARCVEHLRKLSDAYDRQWHQSDEVPDANRETEW